jgi:hypothetical protein
MSDNAIITAIDAAILAGAAGPGEVQSADGRRIRYRSLDELIKARDRFAAMDVTTGSNPASRLRIGRFRSGGTV